MAVATQASSPGALAPEGVSPFHAVRCSGCHLFPHAEPSRSHHSGPVQRLFPRPKEPPCDLSVPLTFTPTTGGQAPLIAQAVQLPGSLHVLLWKGELLTSGERQRESKQVWLPWKPSTLLLLLIGLGFSLNSPPPQPTTPQAVLQICHLSMSLFRHHTQSCHCHTMRDNRHRVAL